MNFLLLLVLDSWQVAYGQGLLDRLHTYDIVRYEVSVEPRAVGAQVDCRLTLEVEKSGPLRFFLSAEVESLRVERDGKPVEAVLDPHHVQRFFVDGIIEEDLADVRNRTLVVLSLEQDARHTQVAHHEFLLDDRILFHQLRLGEDPELLVQLGHGAQVLARLF